MERSYLLPFLLCLAVFIFGVSPTAAAAPSITSNPATATSAAEFTLTCTLDGGQTSSIVWKKKIVSVVTEIGEAAGKATLTITAASSTAGHKYFCNDGSENSAEITVLEKMEAPGDSCAADANKYCNPAKLVCDTRDYKCKTVVKAAGDKCPANTICDSATLVCEGAGSAAMCKLKADQGCDPQASKCMANSECSTKAISSTCTCKTGYTKKGDLTCGKSSAAGMAASLLLVLSAFVTSRFL